MYNLYLVLPNKVIHIYFFTGDQSNGDEQRMI